MQTGLLSVVATGVIVVGIGVLAEGWTSVAPLESYAHVGSLPHQLASPLLGFRVGFLPSRHP